MKKLILISIITLLFSNIYAAGPPNPNCLPFSPCWCADKPNHPKCRPNTNVPINGGIGFLALAGLLLGIYYHRVIRKEVKINTIPCKDCIYNRVESEIEFSISASKGEYCISQFNTGQMNHLIGKIKSVHHLQNLYQDLKREELKMK